MKNKFFLKVLSCLFVVVMLLASIPFVTLAADTETIDSSDVMSDLEKYGIDKTKYQFDREADHIRMLYFLEYGYDYYGNTADYGLYVYIWNPTGVPIYTIGELYGRNFIQMQTRSSLGSVQNGFRKFKLQLCNYSTEQGYEHLFYKFKVVDAKSIYQTLDKDWRQYDISGIELSRSEDQNPTDYGVAQLITCTGFMPYHAASKVAKSTYQSQGVDRLTVELELHPATWKTSTSDKGEGYQYEMFSTYFSVPNDVIRDYGDTANATKGLVQVDGTFEEYKIGGIMTSHSKLYELVLPYLRTEVPLDAHHNEDVPFWFYSTGYEQGLTTIKCRYKFNQTREFPYSLDADKTLRYITNVIYYYGDISSVDPSMLKTWIYDQIEFKYESEFLPWVDKGCTFGFQPYSVSDDDGDLGKLMASFADGYKNGKFFAWLYGLNDLVNGSETYSGIEPIRVVSVSDVLATRTDEAIGRDLFVDPCYVDSLQSEVNTAAAQNKTTYMIRYAVRDYYCDDINVGTKDASSYGFNDGNYYFEKTIFHNFDVLSLTYENKFGDRTVIPVVSSPIDNFGTVTPPPGEDSFDDPDYTVIDTARKGCQKVLDYRPIVILFAVLIGLALANWILSWFNLSLGKLFKALWRLVTWPFRQLWKLFKRSSKKRKKKPKNKLKKAKRKRAVSVEFETEEIKAARLKADAQFREAAAKAEEKK